MGWPSPIPGLPSYPGTCEWISSLWSHSPYENWPRNIHLTLEAWLSGTAGYQERWVVHGIQVTWWFFRDFFHKKNISMVSGYCKSKRSWVEVFGWVLADVLFFWLILWVWLTSKRLWIVKNDLLKRPRMHSNETSPEMRHIRVLENRLDKVMIKYNEATGRNRRL